jgi:hypothetical protein
VGSSRSYKGGKCAEALGEVGRFHGVPLIEKRGEEHICILSIFRYSFLGSRFPLFSSVGMGGNLFIQRIRECTMRLIEVSLFSRIFFLYMTIDYDVESN